MGHPVGIAVVLQGYPLPSVRFLETQNYLNITDEEGGVGGVQLPQLAGLGARHRHLYPCISLMSSPAANVTERKRVGTAKNARSKRD